MPPKKSKDAAATTMTFATCLSSIPLDEQDRYLESQSVPMDVLRKLYGLDQPPCVPDQCKSNCARNPDCLTGLAPKNAKKAAARETDDPHYEVKNQGIPFAGLRNLGATCYMNSIIQCLYSNTVFRRGLYASFERSEDECVKQLALLFAKLQEGKNRYQNTEKLVESLGLEKGVQQDVQEFIQLLLSYLEDQFSATAYRDLVQQQFGGRYGYETWCKTCGYRSSNPTAFIQLELGIQNCSTLEECFDALLGEEELTDDNKYACPKCGVKVVAGRALRLHKLPPVLNLQLMRFTFDIRTGDKKKNGAVISFPRELDLSSRVANCKNRLIYDLHAVVCHSGPSAHHGHYTARIKKINQIDGQEVETWWNIDDELVTLADTLWEPPKGSGAGKKKQPAAKRARKGTKGKASGDVIVIDDNDDDNNNNNDDDDDKKDNDVQMVEIADSEEDAKNNNDKKKKTNNNGSSSSSSNGSKSKSGGKRKANGSTVAENNNDSSEKKEPSPNDRSHLKDAYMLIYIRREERQEIEMGECALPAALVEHVSKSNEELNEEVARLVNQQQNLDIMHQEKEENRKLIMNDAKCASDEKEYRWIKWDWLKQWAQRKDVLQVDNTQLCCPHNKLLPNSDCKFKRIKLRAWNLLACDFGGGPELTEESLCGECILQKLQELRNTREEESGVGLLRKCLEEKEVKNGYWVSKRWIKSVVKIGNKLSLPSLNELEEEVTCRHGRLTAKEQLLEIVPESARPYLERLGWNTWLTTSEQGCGDCVMALGQLAIAKAERQQMKSKLKHFHAQNAMKLEPCKVYYAVHGPWMQWWREYVDDTDMEKKVISNNELVCEHGMLKVDLCSLKDCYEHFQLVKESDWKYLLEHFGGGPELTVEFSADQFVADSTSGKRGIEPSYFANMKDANDVYLSGEMNLGICCECSKMQKSQADVKCFEFENENIIVHCISEATTTVDGGGGGVNASNATTTASSSASVGASSQGSDQNRRTSRRRQFSRNGKSSVQVSSTFSVTALRNRIQVATGVEPRVQRLYFEGRELIDDCVRLSELGVYVGCTIQLERKSEEEAKRDDEAAFEKVVGPKKPETGFKGSVLTGGGGPSLSQESKKKENDENVEKEAIII